MPMPVQNFGMGGLMQGAVARESGRPLDRPRMVPRDLPPPQIQNEPTLEEMMNQSLYFQLLEERLRNRPPTPPRQGPYGNPYLSPDRGKYRIDENAPIQNPWRN